MSGLNQLRFAVLASIALGAFALVEPVRELLRGEDESQNAVTAAVGACMVVAAVLMWRGSTAARVVLALIYLLTAVTILALVNFAFGMSGRTSELLPLLATALALGAMFALLVFSGPLKRAMETRGR